MDVGSNNRNRRDAAIGNPVHRRKCIALAAGAILVLAGLVPAAPAGEVASRYSSLAVDDCRQIAADEESGSVQFTCDGLGGVPVWLAEGDLRIFIGYGAQPRRQCVSQQTFGSFNTVGDKLEWRLDGGKPVATIVRYRLDDGQGNRSSFLAVTALKQEQACHIAYVDGGLPEHNSIARMLADTQARGFDCAKDTPMLLSKRPLQLSHMVSGAPCADDAAMKFQE